MAESIADKLKKAWKHITTDSNELAKELRRIDPGYIYQSGSKKTALVKRAKDNIKKRNKGIRASKELKDIPPGKKPGMVIGKPKTKYTPKRKVKGRGVDEASRGPKPPKPKPYATQKDKRPATGIEIPTSKPVVKKKTVVKNNDKKLSDLGRYVEKFGDKRIPIAKVDRGKPGRTIGKQVGKRKPAVKGIADPLAVKDKSMPKKKVPYQKMTPPGKAMPKKKVVAAKKKVPYQKMTPPGKAMPKKKVVAAKKKVPYQKMTPPGKAMPKRARSIKEAREMGVPHFYNKAGKKLAAVTKEELAASGAKDLTAYLNRPKSGKSRFQSTTKKQSSPATSAKMTATAPAKTPPKGLVPPSVREKSKPPKGLVPPSVREKSRVKTPKKSKKTLGFRKISGPDDWSGGIREYETPFGNITLDSSQENLTPEQKERKKIGLSYKKGGQIKVPKKKKVGKKKQGYKARKDESIAMRVKKKRTKKQLKASRSDSYGKFGKGKGKGKINRSGAALVAASYD